MADFVTGLTRLVVRLLLVAMGLVVVASLVAAALLLAALWLARALWAKLTGRPVSPWVMRVNPGDGWNRVFRAAASGQRQGAAQAERAAPARNLADVTDVQIKER